MNLKGSCQSPTLKFIHFSTKEGLPSSQIYQAFQDSKGYMWFTTDHGLVKYNGYEFKIFTTEDGLTDNTVFRIFEDHKKRLWMLTFAGGICIYDKGKIEPYKYNAAVKAEIRGSIPLGFYVDSLENVFVTTHQWGEFSIDNKGNLKHEFQFKIDRNLHQVFIDEHDKNALIFSIASYDDTKRPMILYYHSKTERDSIVIPLIRQRKVFPMRLKSNRLLVSIHNRIMELKGKKIEELIDLPADIYYMFQDSRERLWVGTSDGVYIFGNTNDFTNHTHYLNKNFISNIDEDNEGGFWITTLSNGIYYLANDQIKNYSFDNEILNTPLVITSDFKSRIFAGYWSGAVATLENQSIKNVNTSKVRTEINCLLYDTTNSRVYIGSRISGFLFNDAFQPFDKLDIPSVPLCFIKSATGNIYGAGDRVLYRLKKDSIVILGEFKIRVNTIYETKPGELLLGTNSGAFVFNEQTGKISLYCDQLKDVRIDNITSFKNYLCFATRGRGLLLKQNDTFKWITQQEGLASNLVHKIVVDENNIWCATNNGVSELVFSDIDRFRFTVRNVNTRDGLPSNEVNDLMIFNDTLYAATSEGISFFNSRINFSNLVSPPVYYTMLRVNNVDTLTTVYYTFRYNLNNIRIGFEAPSFKNTGDISYRYVLSNSEDSIFNTTKSREADFLSLNPGKYVFSVTAINNAGTQSSKPAILKFTILNPFWMEWWFRAAVFLFVAMLTYLLIARHIKRIRKQEETKTAFNKQLVQFEIKALRAQMNPHFIFNVINSIQDYILKNDARSAQKYLTKFARLVRLILDNSVKAEVVLGEELKLAELYVELEQQRFENKFEFNLHVDEEVDIDQIILPAMIIQPYLENAIKHGIRHLPLKGQLILDVRKKENHIIITIEDNGVGRAASAESNKTNVRDHVSYGTIITAKRIDAYNTAYNSDISAKVFDLMDEKEAPSGTRIVLSVPVKYKQMVAG